MKMNRKNLKLTPIRLMAGAGLIMASFLSEATALFDCTRLSKCNRNWEKCKTDSAYFQDCAANCPIKDGKDPIEKCRKAHEEATRVKLAHPGDVFKISCEEAKRLIEVQEELFRLKVATKDYTPEELKFLLRNCTTGTESPADKVKLHHDALSAAVQNRQLKKTEEEVEEKVKPNANDAKPTSNIDPKFAQRMQKIHDQEKLQELLTEKNKTPEQIRDMIKAEPELFHDSKFVEDELKKEEEKIKQPIK